MPVRSMSLLSDLISDCRVPTAHKKSVDGRLAPLQRTGILQRTSRNAAPHDPGPHRVCAQLGPCETHEHV